MRIKRSIDIYIFLFFCQDEKLKKKNVYKTPYEILLYTYKLLSRVGRDDEMIKKFTYCVRPR